MDWLLLIAVDKPSFAVIQPSRLCAYARVMAGRGIALFSFSSLASVALIEQRTGDSPIALLTDPGSGFVLCRAGSDCLLFRD